MQDLRVFILVVALFVCPAAVSDEEPGNEHRLFEFSYELLETELPGGRDIDIYVPLPIQGQGQHLLSEHLSSSHPGVIEFDPVYGNRFFHIKRPADDATPVTASFRWTVARERVTAVPEALSAAAREKYLMPNALVPVGHEILQPIRKEIHRMRKDASPGATARAIYDWVVDNVEYKKVGTGWGNGDTFWACTERYGNCTDFHALFISLARSEGIPARFEIGFPVPEQAGGGKVGGYHCWVRVYLPERGWVPLDASEAAKHPELRELLYGTHPADRIHFSTGRDLVLSSYTDAHPLNYFIYPHIEVDGELWPGRAPTRFSYRTDVDPLAAGLLTQNN